LEALQGLQGLQGGQHRRRPAAACA
jgi:hypothetical protein